MRFKEFLYEAKHRQDISIEKAIELLKANCQDSLKFIDRPLVRGTQAREEAYLIQGELGGRASAHSDSNHYTVILDEVLPAEYPRRSKSIICGNFDNIDWVEQYGYVYALFPYDGVKIGVVPAKDIFLTQFSIGRSKERGMNEWNEIYNEANIPDYSFEDIVRGIEDTLEDEDDDYYDMFSDIFAGGDVESELRRAYSPRSTGMKVITPDQIGSLNGKAHEVWIGGKMIAIDIDVLRDIRKQLL